MTSDASEPTHFDLMGGEAGIRTLVDRFYDVMDSAPEAVNVRALHATSLKSSREKLFLYLMGWTGGPPTYVERYGHPRLRQRHMPFAIGARERDEWLWCMRQAIDEHHLPAPFRDALWLRLMQLADFMRNQEDDAIPRSLPTRE
jgi:hemoglobin